MKIVAPKPSNTDKDIVRGDLVTYENEVCLVIELGCETNSDFNYGLLNLSDTSIVKGYEYLGDIDDDTDVYEYASKDNIELVVKELI